MVRMDKEIPMWKRMERVEEVMKEVMLMCNNEAGKKS